MAAWGDGGGFMPPDSQDTPQRKFATRHDNVVPCTIAQIHMMGQDTLTIGSLEVQYVSLVGLVLSVDQQSTRVNFTLDDRTGPPIEGLIFAQEEEQMRVMSHLVEGSYVRVVGPVRSVEGKRQLKAFKVFPVTDLNELTLHLAEVVHANMALRAKFTPTSAKHEAMDTSSSAFLGGAASNLGLNQQQKLVYEAIRECTTNFGISFDEICSKLKSLNKTSIREVVEFLANEGHIFTTMDDEHYKATDSA
ncbi:replication protein A2 isoform X2 [Amblyomma americanum]|uniref:Replication protein A C-terminal domain-containing protein n=2 Tax=Amblyomma americanum TaxID=6943 RepID=A0AAQ4DR37_AMBAM